MQVAQHITVHLSSDYSLFYYISLFGFFPSYFNIISDLYILYEEYYPNNPLTSDFRNQIVWACLDALEVLVSQILYRAPR